MKAHGASADDIAFRASFEAGRIPADQFGHREHLRLAYSYLVEHDTDSACLAMRDSLRSFLAGIVNAPAKYHETVTRAWVMVIRHFMESTPPCDSADAFIARNPALLDPKLMLNHYSAELLFSERARARFVEPDLRKIPGCDNPPG